MDSKIPSKFYSYGPKTTSISFPWPKEVTGVERMTLSAQGELQRIAFFARPITVALVYSNTFHNSSGPSPSPPTPTHPLTLPNPRAIARAAPDYPILQTRQVHLQCSGKVVCTATSTVRITSPEFAHFFLEEKYAIGQVFAHTGKVPAFELLSVGLGPVPSTGSAGQESPTQVSGAAAGGEEQLWRRYKLFVHDFECEILEVFPSRQMFVGGQQWLDNLDLSLERVSSGVLGTDKEIYHSSVGLVRSKAIGVTFFLGIGLMLIMAFEVSMFFMGRSLLCYI
ncbi:hypothetical protein H0H81_005763 [Sphagnurus paluster]|uniref:Uncharacterized protein n=1 Tax=Sphagnurus paluster TaxID=117069 RepID=A0A9P7GLI0_9AGAR|nr:hypothetical protein H0H81_005763 [Sphagnurus paluster]